MAVCRQCPRECGVDRNSGQIGACGEGAPVRVSRYSLHHWEEPPISGNSGSGTIFFTGCPLGCIYCQNEAISHRGRGNAVSHTELCNMFYELRDIGAMNINLVTPTHFSDGIRDVISDIKSSGFGLPIVWNTSGYETVANIYANAGLVDVYLADMKYADPALGRAFSHVSDYPQVALDAIGAMYESVGDPEFDRHSGGLRMVKGVIVRHMVIPGHADDSKAVLSELFSRFSNRILYSIMNQYTPVLATRADEGDSYAAETLERYPELACTLSESEYEEVLDFADALGIEDYFWQNGKTCKESYIPDF